VPGLRSPRDSERAHWGHLLPSISDLDWALHQLLITRCEGGLDPWDLIKLLSGSGFDAMRLFGNLHGT
jgi:hypothetical protein